MFRSIRAGLVGALLLMGPAVAAPKGPPGATAAELIALARQLSPELAAAALTADAAIARITSAGALPDPTLRVGADNLDQRNISMNGTTTTYRLMQEFPLWGKLDLKQEMATFEATAARYRRQGPGSCAHSAYPGHGPDRNRDAKGSLRSRGHNTRRRPPARNRGRGTRYRARTLARSTDKDRCPAERSAQSSPQRAARDSGRTTPTAE